MSNSPFLNSIRTDMRQKGYALKTEKTYLHWIKRFILFEPTRVFRRQFILSHATLADSSNWR